MCWLRYAIPDLTLCTTVIVGFPGESEQDFEDTMDLVRNVNYASCYSFKYSARPGTPAANMQNLVRDDIATERLARLQTLLNEQQKEFNEQSIGLVMPVLLDRKGKRAGQLQGRTPYNQSLYVQANDRLQDTIVDVRVTEAFDKSLTGEILTQEAVLTA